jgi:hypothetical protein
VDLDFQSQTVIRVSPLTSTPPTNPTPTIILDILAVDLIWDGVVTRVNIITIATSIGVTKDPTTITRAIAKAVSETTNVTATIIIIGNINTRAIKDVIIEGKLNTMTNEEMCRKN